MSFFSQFFIFVPVVSQFLPYLITVQVPQFTFFRPFRKWLQASGFVSIWSLVSFNLFQDKLVILFEHPIALLPLRMCASRLHKFRFFKLQKFLQFINCIATFAQPSLQVTKYCYFIELSFQWFFISYDFRWRVINGLVAAIGKFFSITLLQAF